MQGGLHIMVHGAGMPVCGCQPSPLRPTGPNVERDSAGPGGRVGQRSGSQRSTAVAQRPAGRTADADCLVRALQMAATAAAVRSFGKGGEALAQTGIVLVWIVDLFVTSLRDVMFELGVSAAIAHRDGTSPAIPVCEDE